MAGIYCIPDTELCHAIPEPILGSYSRSFRPLALWKHLLCASRLVFFRQGFSEWIFGVDCRDHSLLGTRPTRAYDESPLRAVRRMAALAWDVSATKRAQLSGVYEACDSRLRRHSLFPVFRAATAFGLSALFWATPPYLMYEFHRRTYQEHWWDRGGKWVYRDAFPEHRTNFVIFAYCAPIWAAYMALLMLGWALFVWVMRRTLRLRFSLSFPTARAAHQRVPSFDLAHSLSEGEFDNQTGHARVRASAPAAKRPREAVKERHVRWWLLLSIYLGITSFGLYCYKNFDNQVDFRTRLQLDTAVSHPRTQGYGRRGAFHSRWSLRACSLSTRM